MGSIRTLLALAVSRVHKAASGLTSVHLKQDTSLLSLVTPEVYKKNKTKARTGKKLLVQQLKP